MHDRSPTHLQNTIIKFADNTTVVGLISNNDETAYTDEVYKFTMWCMENNLLFNVKKTKELLIDFRRQQQEHPPLRIGGVEVERVPSFKFQGVCIRTDLRWTVHSSVMMKKAQQRMYFLRTLRKNNLSADLSKSFHHCSVESSYATASLPGMETVQWLTKQLSRGWLKLHRRSSVSP